MAEELDPRYADRQWLFEKLASREENPAGHIAPQTVITTLLVLDAEGTAAGHGILRDLGGEPEIKRLYVVPEARGKGAAGVLMQALEDHARATGAPRVILQTGDRQPEAEALYLKRGWTPIPIYWPYREMDFSRCYELTLAYAPPA
ncbi:GNAT family N-acetyltransferase [Membranihabitans marinus]